MYTDHIVGKNFGIPIVKILWYTTVSPTMKSIECGKNLTKML